MNDNTDENTGKNETSQKEVAWERQVIEKLAFEAVSEQRRARRWSIFFKSLLFLYLLGIAIAAFDPFSDKSIKSGVTHTAIIDISGVIMAGAPTNSASIIEGLNKAIKNKSTKGIILNVNSPGGSPVQSDYIFHEIRRLKKQHPDIPIHAVVSDLCASGGYYIASAADKIYVNNASLIGSIGVIMNGFGFVPAMEKLGIERRLMIAGAHKALMDPFSPVNDAEKEHVQRLLNKIHLQFITAVREGRGKRLKNDPKIFSGLMWTGAESIELGLADGVGSIRSVAKDVIGAEETVNFTPKEKFFDRLAQQIGTHVGRIFSEALSPRIGF